MDNDGGDDDDDDDDDENIKVIKKNKNKHKRPFTDVDNSNNDERSNDQNKSYKRSFDVSNDDYFSPDKEEDNDDLIYSSSPHKSKLSQINKLNKLKNNNDITEENNKTNNKSNIVVKNEIKKDNNDITPKRVLQSELLDMNKITDNDKSKIKNKSDTSTIKSESIIPNQPIFTNDNTFSFNCSCDNEICYYMSSQTVDDKNNNKEECYFLPCINKDFGCDAVLYKNCCIELFNTKTNTKVKKDTEDDTEVNNFDDDDNVSYDHKAGYQFRKTKCRLCMKKISSTDNNYKTIFNVINIHQEQLLEKFKVPVADYCKFDAEKTVTYKEDEIRLEFSMNSLKKEIQTAFPKDLLLSNDCRDYMINNILQNVYEKGTLRYFLMTEEKMNCKFKKMPKEIDCEWVIERACARLHGDKNEIRREVELESFKKFKSDFNLYGSNRYKHPFLSESVVLGKLLEGYNKKKIDSRKIISDIKDRLLRRLKRLYEGLIKSCYPIKKERKDKKNPPNNQISDASTNGSEFDIPKIKYNKSGDENSDEDIFTANKKINFNMKSGIGMLHDSSNDESSNIIKRSSSGFKNHTNKSKNRQRGDSFWDEYGENDSDGNDDFDNNAPQVTLFRELISNWNEFKETDSFHKAFFKRTDLKFDLAVDIKIVKLQFIIANPLDLFGLQQDGMINNKATLLICITGLLPLYMEIALAYLTNQNLINLRCIALLHHSNSSDNEMLTHLNKNSDGDVWTKHLPIEIEYTGNDKRKISIFKKINNSSRIEVATPFTADEINSAFDDGLTVCESVFGSRKNNSISGGSFSVIDSGKESVIEFISTLELCKNDNPIDIGFGYPALICILSSLLKTRIIGTEINSGSVFSTLFHKAIARDTNLSNEAKTVINNLIPTRRSNSRSSISKPNSSSFIRNNNLNKSYSKATPKEAIEVNSDSETEEEITAKIEKSISTYGKVMCCYKEYKIHEKTDMVILDSSDAWLNDELMNLAIRYCCDNSLEKSKYLKIRAFEIQWYDKLLKVIQGKSSWNEKSLKKISSVLFDLDLLFIPINYPKNTHWILVVLCNLSKFCGDINTVHTHDNNDNDFCLFVLDSMCHNDKKRVKELEIIATNILDYIAKVYQIQYNIKIEIDKSNRLPLVFILENYSQQPNSYDCGLYVIKSVEKILELKKKLDSDKSGNKNKILIESINHSDFINYDKDIKNERQRLKQTILEINNKNEKSRSSIPLSQNLSQESNRNNETTPRYKCTGTDIFDLTPEQFEEIASVEKEAKERKEKKEK